MVVDKTSKTKKAVATSSTKKAVAENTTKKVVAANTTKKVVTANTSKKVETEKKVGVSRKKINDKSKIDRLKALSSVDTAKISSNESEIKINNKTKKNGFSAVLVALLVIIAIVCIVVMFLYNKKSDTSTNKIENVTETVTSNNNASSKFAEPENATDVNFEVENGVVNKLVYKKEVDSGSEMTFVLRAAPAEEDIVDTSHLGGTPILMTVVCKDEQEVEVVSYVATDTPNYMRANWFDNDMYYSMITDTLVTREDFLQEVNRAIIANHVSF